MQVVIIIPVYNHLEFTKLTLNDLSEGIQTVNDCSFSIVLVDDGSTDGTSDWVTAYFPDVHVLKGDGNLWWSGAVNLAARFALEKLNCDYILLWNNDVTFEESYFPILVRTLKAIDTKTIIGSKILIAGKPDIIWSMGGYFNPVTGRQGMYGYFEKNTDKYEKVLNAEWLTGMGTVIPRHIIEKIGYWDNINFPQYYGDCDFTYRAKLEGYSILVQPDLIIFNSVTNSGLEHSGNFKRLLNLLTDTRSKSNFKRNLKFYNRYAKSWRAFLYFYWQYFKLFGGFFKWKILKLFSIKEKRIK